MPHHRIICGKSEMELKQFEDNTFDSCVTDPPYNLTSITRPRPDQTKNGSYGKEVPFSRGQSRMSGGFMGKEWDSTGIPFKVELWEEVYRVMKPGAHILVFGGDRTEHRMKCAVEDAAFEIRGTIVWVYGSGFPKSLDISKKLDQMAGEERVVGGYEEPFGRENRNAKKGFRGSYVCGAKGTEPYENLNPIMLPISEEAIKYDGWGTGLKPSVELICMARKPISERNIASNVLKWGVGGINVDGCRIKTSENISDNSKRESFKDGWMNAPNFARPKIQQEEGFKQHQQGRFPANLILECCCEEVINEERKASTIAKHNSKGTFIGKLHKDYETINYNDAGTIHTNPNCVCRMLDEQSGELQSGQVKEGYMCHKRSWFVPNNEYPLTGIGDKGGASRFFYQAKASQKERWFFCTICKQAYPMKERDKHIHGAPEKEKYQYLEFHPTQKPEDLIAYLMRLITPPSGAVIDPFLGSGTAIIAAEREGFNCVGIDSKPVYCEMALRRGKSKLIQQKISGEPSTIGRTGF